MKPTPPSLRKAAVLVASLEPHESARILASMSLDQRRAIEAAVESLGPIDRLEQSAVIEEFFRIGPLAPPPAAAVELDLQSLRDSPAATAFDRATALPPSRHDDALDAYTARYLSAREATDDDFSAPRPDERSAAPPLGPLAASAVARKPFESLHVRDDRQLALALAAERPQTIAVVVSHLAPSRAAAMLSHLPAALQADVARRLVEIEAADPETLREIERGLEARLSRAGLALGRSAGLGALLGILSAADDSTRAELLDNLRLHDRSLATQIARAAAQSPPHTQSPPSYESLPGMRATERGQLDAAILAQRADFGAARTSRAATRPTAGQASAATTRLVETTFADLEQLDDESLSTVLHAADTEVMVLALAGASTRLAGRVLGQLPVAESRALRYAMDHLGPTRLADVEEAQRRVARLAAELRHDGRLGGRAKRSLSVAV